MFVTQPTLHDRRQPTQPCCSPSHSLVFNCSHAGYCAVWNGAPAGAPTYPLQSSISFQVPTPYGWIGPILIPRITVSPVLGLEPSCQEGTTTYFSFPDQAVGVHCVPSARGPSYIHSSPFVHLPFPQPPVHMPPCQPPRDPACSYQWPSVSLELPLQILGQDHQPTLFLPSHVTLYWDCYHPSQGLG